MSLVRDGMVAIETTFVDRHTFSDLTEEELAEVEPAIAWEKSDSGLIDIWDAESASIWVDPDDLQPGTVVYYGSEATYHLVAKSDSGWLYGVVVNKGTLHAHATPKRGHRLWDMSATLPGACVTGALMPLTTVVASLAPPEAPPGVTYVKQAPGADTAFIGW